MKSITECSDHGGLPKLIRDRIPEVLDLEGVSYKTEEMDSESFKKALRLKLVEEAVEVSYASSHDDLVGELADLLEVVASLVSTFEIDSDDLNRARQRIYLERGGFEKKLRLIFIDQEVRR